MMPAPLSPLRTLLWSVLLSVTVGALVVGSTLYKRPVANAIRLEGPEPEFELESPLASVPEVPTESLAECRGHYRSCRDNSQCKAQGSSGRSKSPEPLGLGWGSGIGTG